MVVKCILIFTMIVWKFIRREHARRSIIQDRDPLTVPSTRRNPVLADIFNRLEYMERKGSGFGKSSAAMNFRSTMMKVKAAFRSDRYQFTVVMPNLNYNVPQKKRE